MEEVIVRAAHVTPSPRQLAWQRLEFTAFIHFTVNTFTDREWGDGTESPAIFNPTRFDARQWAQVCKDAGMKGLILTAKHHDGFCLWPSQYTEHSVKNSPFRDGKGDVVAETAAACREYGLKFGIYLSPWDRHEATYGSEQYNVHFKNQLRELLSNYGDIYCVWFDGACGEGPNGKRQVYDWDGYYEVIRELQPGAVISVCGPDVRWCGNEAGHTRPSEWSVVPAYLRDQEKIIEKSQHEDDAEFSHRVTTQDQDLGSRERLCAASELVWYPAEVDTSIRPGWFYHAEQDSQVKSLEQLLEIYYGSVGNAVLLLNLPPTPEGLIHGTDAARMRELGETLRETFRENLAAGAAISATESLDVGHGPDQLLDGSESTYWTPNPGTEKAMVELTLPEPKSFNLLMLQEHIACGQRIESFKLQIWSGLQWETIAESTVVGYKRLLRFDTVTADRVRVAITSSRVCPTLANIGMYYRQPL